MRTGLGTILVLAGLTGVVVAITQDRVPSASCSGGAPTTSIATAAIRETTPFDET